MSQLHREIERKFLLRDLPYGIISHPSVKKSLYNTAYLLVGDPEIRIRQRMVLNPNSNETSFSMAVKFGEGIHRWEFESDIKDKDFFNEQFTKGSLLAKVRYKLQDGWCFDDFRLKGGTLYIAEIEFDSLDKSKELLIPEWLSPLIIKEVTDDIRYFNRNLAVNGVPNPE